MLRLILEMDGEVVERADPHIGLLHRGTEKLIEYKTYMQAVPYFDRLDYVSPMCEEHAFALAVEKLLGIEVPERGAMDPRAVRRDHPRAEPPAEPDDLRAGCRRHHAEPVGLRGAREADGVLRGRLAARGCTRTISAPAACRRTCRPGWTDKIAAWAETFPKFIDDLEELLTGNRIWKQRTVDIGVMSAGGGAGLGLLRPAAARLRRAVGPAPRPAVRQIRRGRLQDPGRPQRRLLRPLSGAHRRDAREREDHPAVPGEDEARSGEGAGPQVLAADARAR